MSEGRAPRERKEVVNFMPAEVKVTEDIVDGLENAPQALIGLLAGENKGKRMVRVAADPS